MRRCRSCLATNSRATRSTSPGRPGTVRRSRREIWKWRKTPSRISGRSRAACRATVSPMRRLTATRRKRRRSRTRPLMNARTQAASGTFTTKAKPIRLASLGGCANSTRIRDYSVWRAGLRPPGSISFCRTKTAMTAVPTKSRRWISMPVSCFRRPPPVLTGSWG